MTRNKKNEEKPDGLGEARPARDARPLPADLQAHIGVRLKAFYDSVLSEPIPDRFAELLNKLDTAEEPRTKQSPDGGTDGKKRSSDPSSDETGTDVRS